MRIVRRGSGGEAASLAPVVIAVALIALSVLGAGGAAIVKSAARTTESASRLGPQRNYAALPSMTFALGGAAARRVDVRALLEIDPGVDSKVAVPYLPRISEQMSDRMREIEPEQLSGADGARLMKSTIAAVVVREVRSLRVRDVLLERMIVR